MKDRYISSSLNVESNLQDILGNSDVSITKPNSQQKFESNDLKGK